MQSSPNDLQSGLAGSGSDDPMPSTSDFVKKLFRMLEDQSFQHVVSWGPQGDCFVVKDMNEFTKSILPRMFKHSNFASFVRQLNKYDFHKVKNTDDNQFGDHSWTFRHPDFHANRRDALENIKRKVPAGRKPNTSTSSSTTTRPLSPTNYSSHQLHHHPYQSPSPSASIQTQVHVETLQNEVRRLREEGEDMRTRIRTLERNYESVLLELVSFQRGMAQQDGVVQNLIRHLMSGESGKAKALASMLPSQLQSQPQQRQSPPTTQSQSQPQARLPSQPQPIYSQSTMSTPIVPSEPSLILLGSAFPEQNPFLPYHTAQRIIRRYPESASADAVDVARATLLEMNELSRRAEDTRFEAEGRGEGGGGDGLTGMENPTAIGIRRVAGDSKPVSAPVSSSETPRATSSGLQTSEVTSGGDGHASGKESAGGGAKARPPSRIWQAAASAGILNGLGTGSVFVGAGPSTSKMAGSQEAVEVNMEEMQNNAPRAESSDAWLAAQGLNSLAGSRPGGGGGGGGGGASTGTPGTTTAGTAWSPSMDDEDSHPIMTHEGLQVYTVGHLLPREAIMNNSRWSVDVSGGANGPGAFVGMEQAQEQSQRQRSQQQQQQQQQQQPEFNYPYNASIRSSLTPSGEGGDNNGEEEEEIVRPSLNKGTLASEPAATVQLATTRKLRVRRSTFVPGWAVPPRVLLVDDDAVTRQLSSKFLQVFGCTIDVAVDGVGAVNKMNLEKYDLVLMDIVMPKLDGMSATSLIRQFDCMTPIISMTSNSKPNEILKYFSSGMNDILPKPFTKQGLLDMLEKHLAHLRAIQQMSRIPRPLEITNGEGSSSASRTSFTTASSSNEIPSFVINGESVRYEDDDRINPIAGFGLTDEQYNLIVQDIVNADTFGEGSSGSAVVGVASDELARIGGSSGSNALMDGMGLMSVAVLGLGEKRGLEDSSEAREGKRCRFEAIE